MEITSEERKLELLKEFINTMEIDLVMGLINVGYSTISKYLSSTELFIMIIKRDDITRSSKLYLKLLNCIFSYRYCKRRDLNCISRIHNFKRVISNIKVEERENFWNAYKYNKDNYWEIDITELKRYLAIREIMPEVLNETEKNIKDFYISSRIIETIIELEDEINKEPEMLTNIIYKNLSVYNNRRVYNDKKILDELTNSRIKDMNKAKEVLEKANSLGFIEDKTLEKWKKCMIDVVI